MRDYFESKKESIFVGAVWPEANPPTALFTFFLIRLFHKFVFVESDSNSYKLKKRYFEIEFLSSE